MIFSLMHFCFSLFLFLHLLIFVCVSFALRDIPKRIAKVNVKEHACMLSHFRHAPLCDPIGHSLPGFSVHEILQA